MRELNLLWYKIRELHHVQGDELDIPLRASRVYERVGDEGRECDDQWHYLYIVKNGMNFM